jgi:mRNA interferase RelE/StbE
VYAVRFTPGAQRGFEKAPVRDKKRLLEAVQSLARNPRRHGAIKLTRALYRIRVGPWRIIYAISEQDREVVVVKVARRSEDTYKGL